MFNQIFAVLILSIFLAEGAAPQRLRPQCRANVCDDRPECPRTSCSCLFPSQIDCAVYYQCLNGKPYQYKCSPGLLFNPETLTCDYSKNVNCSMGTSPSSEILNTTSSLFESTSTITTTRISTTITDQKNDETTTMSSSTRNVETTTPEPSSRQEDTETATEIATTTESPNSSKDTTTLSPTTETPEITTEIHTTETEAISSSDTTKAPQTEETQTEKKTTTESDVASTTISIRTSSETDTSAEPIVTDVIVTNSSITSTVKITTEEDTTSYQVLTTTIPSTDFTCPSRFGLFPDPQNCFRFYHCSHWVPYHKWCPSNLHFNPKLKVCDWPYRAGCESSFLSTPSIEPSSTIKPEIINGTCDCDCCELPVPDDCSAYILCIDRVAFRMQCSADLYFNPMTGTCDFRENVQCDTGDVECQEPFGRFLYPGSCSYFVECQNGKKTTKKCPEGLYFNQTSEMCSWTGSCSDDQSKHLPDSQTITDNTICNGCSYCFKPYKADCAHYVRCSEDLATEERCASGLYFNPATELCDHDYNVKCPGPEPQTECPQKYGYFPYPGECSKYLHCVNGSAAVKSCPGVLHFDPVKKHCDWPWVAGCGSPDVSPTPEPKPDIISCDCECCLKPTGDDCRSFILCIGQVGFKKSCSSGLLFNPQTENCDFAENVNCIIIPDEPENVCPEHQGLFPYPEDCRKFIHCSHGIPYVKNCPSDLHFNPHLKVCDWPYSAGCQSFPSVSPPTDDNELPCDICDSCFIPDENDCSSYIYCSNGKGYRLRCTENLLFNPEIEACDLANNVKCPNKPDTQCPKPDGLFPAKDCSRFLHCSNGIAYLKDCPDGLHFNVQTLVCDWPENANCGETPVEPTKPDDNVDDFNQTCDCDCCFLPNPKDCSKYYLCLDGYMYEGQCSRGLLFNPDIQNCDLAERVTCGEISPLCPEPNGLFPNPGHCSSFIKCSNAEPETEYCRVGTHFSAQEKQCLDPCEAKCDFTIDCSTTSSLVTPSTPESFICLEPDGFYPAVNDCTSYYVCVNGQPQLVQCPKGLHYNTQYEVCEDPCDAKCNRSLDCSSPSPEPSSTTSIISSSSTVGDSSVSPICVIPNGMYPIEDDCSAFYQCSHGRPYLITCPSGLHFSAEDLICEHPCLAHCDPTLDCSSPSTTRTTPSSSTPSPHCADGRDGLFPSNDDCASFYQCAEGRAYLMKCPRGLHFSYELQVCEQPCIAKCDETIDCTSSTKPESSSSTTLQTFSPECIEANGLFPNTNDCGSFYQCSNGRSHLIRCPSGLHFNLDDAACERPCVAGCNKSIDCSTTTPKPVSSTLSPHCPTAEGLYPIPGDCTSFYSCSNGKGYLIQCPPGLHYSEGTETCENPCDALCNVTIDCISSTRPESSSTTALQTLSPECLEDNGLFPNPDDCGSFYQCSNGRSHLIRCPSGLHFNVDDAACERPCVAGCNKSIDCSVTTPKPASSTLSPHCPTADGLFPNPDDCGSFYQCSNGKSHLIQCPSGLHFSLEDAACEKPCAAGCNKSIDCSVTTLKPASSTLSPYCPTADGLFPNPDDCGSFYQCSNGKSHLIRCPSGLHFSLEDAACEKPCAAGCNKSIDCSPTTPKPTSSTLSPHCPTTEGLYPVAGDCTAFYLCSNGKEHLIHCPPGLHYSEEAETCENPCDARCNVTIDCVSTTKPEPSSSSTPEPLSPECLEANGLYPNPDDCGSFYQCSNGRSHLIRCPNGLHFSLDDAVCERPCVAGCDISIVCPTEIPETEGNCTCEACYLPDPDDCSGFYFCSNRMLTKGYCPYGMLFDKISSQCKDEDKVNCEANGDPSMCPEPFGFYPYPGDCKKFLHCENSVAHIRECDGNLEYDPENRVCTKPKGYCGDVVPDPHCPEPTGLFPDSEDCSLFYHCEHGVAYPKRCSLPLMFNPAKEVCDWPENVNCGKDTTPISLPPSSSSTDSSSIYSTPSSQQSTETPSSPSSSSSSIYSTPSSQQSTETPSFPSTTSSSIYSTPSSQQSTEAPTSTPILTTRQPCYEVPGVVCPCACRVPTYDDCSSFFQCQEDGTACKKYCPLGLYFNKREMVCDLPSNVECREFFFTTMRRSKQLSQQLRASPTKS